MSSSKVKPGFIFPLLLQDLSGSSSCVVRRWRIHDAESGGKNDDVKIELFYVFFRPDSVWSELVDGVRNQMDIWTCESLWGKKVYDGTYII